MRFLILPLILLFSSVSFANSFYFFCETQTGNQIFDNVGFEGNFDETNGITKSYFVPTVGYGGEELILLEHLQSNDPNYLWQAQGDLTDGTSIQILVEKQSRRRKIATFIFSGIFSGAETQETRRGFCVINPVR
jgi:hypothetical protein